MYTRHNEVPVYQCLAGVVEAVHFNRVQTAFRRLGEEIRLTIPGLKTVDLILQQDAWIIVDRAFHDLPVAAWGDFDTLHRDALHTPVPCRLKLYHANAGIIINRVLDAMELLLGERLLKAETGHQVISFTGRK